MNEVIQGFCSLGSISSNCWLVKLCPPWLCGVLIGIETCIINVCVVYIPDLHLEGYHFPGGTYSVLKLLNGLSTFCWESESHSVVSDSLRPHRL